MPGAREPDAAVLIVQPNHRGAALPGRPEGPRFRASPGASRPPALPDLEGAAQDDQPEEHQHDQDEQLLGWERHDRVHGVLDERGSTGGQVLRPTATTDGATGPGDLSDTLTVLDHGGIIAPGASEGQWDTGTVILPR